MKILICLLLFSTSAIAQQIEPTISDPEKLKTHLICEGKIGYGLPADTNSGIVAGPKYEPGYEKCETINRDWEKEHFSKQNSAVERRNEISTINSAIQKVKP